MHCSRKRSLHSRPVRNWPLMRESGFYAEWKARFGNEAWGLLEQTVGKLA